jgi:hypothetical protein
MKAPVSMLALPMLISACAGPSMQVEATSPAALARSAAVAEQVRRCYRRPGVPSVGRHIVTRLLARYGPDGALIGLPLVVGQQGVRPENRHYAGRMAEAARLAVTRCNPVRLPPEKGKPRGSDFFLTFSPGMRA